MASLGLATGCAMIAAGIGGFASRERTARRRLLSYYPSLNKAKPKTGGIESTLHLEPSRELDLRMRK